MIPDSESRLNLAEASAVAPADPARQGDEITPIAAIRANASGPLHGRTEAKRSRSCAGKLHRLNQNWHRFDVPWRAAGGVAQMCGTQPPGGTVTCERFAEGCFPQLKALPDDTPQCVTRMGIQKLRVLLVEDSVSDAKLLVHELRRGAESVEFERVQLRMCDHERNHDLEQATYLESQDLSK